MLENLEPAKKIEPTPFGRPGVIFDGNEGEATTPYSESPATFEEFIEAAGMNPEEFEVIGTPRISKWQQKEDGDFLTSFRFTFRKRVSGIDLPLLYAQAKKTVKEKKRFLPEQKSDKALIVCWSDSQTGKANDIRRPVSVMRR